MSISESQNNNALDSLSPPVSAIANSSGTNPTDSPKNLNHRIIITLLIVFISIVIGVAIYPQLFPNSYKNLQKKLNIIPNRSTLAVDSVEASRQKAILKAKDSTSQISLSNNLINEGADGGCTVFPPTQFGETDSIINCEYRYYYYSAGSGNKAEDIGHLYSILQSIGWRSNTELDPVINSRVPSPMEFTKGDYLSNGSINVIVFDNIDQIKSGAYRYPKEPFVYAFSKTKYIYGFTYEFRYVQSKCGDCTNFIKENKAKQYPDFLLDINEQDEHINFRFLTYTLPSRFDKVSRQFSGGATYEIYNKTSTQPKNFGNSHFPELDIIQFKRKLYYNPPESCGDDNPSSGSVYPCTLITVTPKGKKIYLSSILNNPNSRTLFIEQDGTLVVVRESEHAGLTPENQLTSNELIDLVDSLGDATLDQIKAFEKAAKTY